MVFNSNRAFPAQNSGANMNAANYGGHNDWRLPNRFELDSLADLGRGNPAIDPTFFNAACSAPCNANACSCTRSGTYWSSTTYQVDPRAAWAVGYDGGATLPGLKGSLNSVRAVRGGS
jgi:hypothetical protein